VRSGYLSTIFCCYWHILRSHFTQHVPFDTVGFTPTSRCCGHNKPTVSNGTYCVNWDRHFWLYVNNCCSWHILRSQFTQHVPFDTVGFTPTSRCCGQNKPTVSNRTCCVNWDRSVSGYMSTIFARASQLTVSNSTCQVHSARPI
jgi:hypothetical protein